MFNEKKFKGIVLNNNSYQLSLLTRNKACLRATKLFVLIYYVHTRNIVPI